MIATVEVVRMVEAIERREPIPIADPDRSYNPDRVASWLENWAVLKELALLTPRSTSRFREILIHGKGGGPRDPMEYVHIICDLQVAWGMMTPGSLEYWAVEAMIWGSTFRQAEHDHHRRHGSIAEAYPRACREIAERLGWRPRATSPLTGDKSSLIIHHDLVESQAGGLSK